MPQAPFVRPPRPPRIAAWLTSLFTPEEHLESIPGDLLEEFSNLASKSGVASARRWYWRQSAKTIAHLMGAGFRDAPWWIVGIVLGGWLLLAVSFSLPERAIVAVLDFHRHHVVPYHTRLDLWLFWFNAAILTGRFIEAMLVGGIVAMAVKGKEMVATITLGLFRGALTVIGFLVAVTKQWPDHHFFVLGLIWGFGVSIAIVVGGGIVRKVRFRGKMLLVAICLAAAAGSVAFGFVNAPAIRAQSLQRAGASLPSFEVASIKLDQSGTRGRFFQFPDPGRFNTLNMPAKDMIEFAYNVKPFRVSGGPSWIESQGYDVEAKVEDSLVGELQKLPPDQRIDQIRLMLRSLLADRFKLSLSHDTKELPIYALIVAKGGPKLTPTTFTPPDPNAPRPSTPPANGPHLMMSPGKVGAVAQSMSGLADLLARDPDLGGRLVLDQTGIKGNYDFEVHFTQENPFPNAPLGAGNSPPPSDTSGPSIFTAIQEQLGLKLESTKGPVEVYVIDHVEEPSEN